MTTADKKIITFTNGILGLEQYKSYVLLDHPGTDVVKWLEAVDAPEIALPVTNPFYFFQTILPRFPGKIFFK